MSLHVWAAQSLVSADHRKIFWDWTQQLRNTATHWEAASIGVKYLSLKITSPKTFSLFSNCKLFRKRYHLCHSNKSQDLCFIIFIWEYENLHFLPFLSWNKIQQQCWEFLYYTTQVMFPKIIKKYSNRVSLYVSEID